MAKGEKINVTEDISAEDIAGRETRPMSAISGTCRQHHGDKREEPRAGGVGGPSSQQQLHLSRVSHGTRGWGRGTEGRTAFRQGDSRAKGYQCGARPVRKGHVGTTPREVQATHTSQPRQPGLQPPQTTTLHLVVATATPSHLVLLSTQSNPVKAEMDGETPP